MLRECLGLQVRASSYKAHRQGYKAHSQARQYKANSSKAIQGTPKQDVRVSVCETDRQGHLHRVATAPQGGGCTLLTGLERIKKGPKYGLKCGKGGAAAGPSS